VRKRAIVDTEPLPKAACENPQKLYPSDCIIDKPAANLGYGPEFYGQTRRCHPKCIPGAGAIMTGKETWRNAVVPAGSMNRQFSALDASVMRRERTERLFCRHAGDSGRVPSFERVLSRCTMRKQNIPRTRSGVWFRG